MSSSEIVPLKKLVLQKRCSLSFKETVPDSLITFKFLKLFQIDVELKRQSELKDNIQVLEDDLKKLLDFKGKMSDAVEEFKCFEDTITELVKDSEHISTTKDFMDKCDSLSELLVLYFIP